MESAMYRAFYWSFLITILLSIRDCLALQPQNSETRSTQKLDGIWSFRVDDSATRNMSFVDNWMHQDLTKTGAVIAMPVPSSYNDITTEARIRDFVGWAWYDRRFYVDQSWSERRVFLRFGSCHYECNVYLNGKLLMTHSGGHLPFESEVTSKLNYNGDNLISVAVNNTLTPTTLPPGSIEYKNKTNRYPAGYFVQNLQMDFFNYAGIHRSVLLYTTPKSYINDIYVWYELTGTPLALVNYVVDWKASDANTQMKIALYHENGTAASFSNKILVSNKTNVEGILYVRNPILWWPYTNTPHGETPAYMYTMKVEIYSNAGIIDVYRQLVGIRVIKTNDKQILVNNQPFYCQGVAKHEDSDIRGKGVDLPLIARDFNLLKFIRANCFRTSHYPYAEEIMDMADKTGIMVIDESPGVGIKEWNMGNVSLTHHQHVMKEMFSRDKNRPSVLMWSVANEPQSGVKKAGPYFKAVIDTIRALDQNRPVTFVIGPGNYWDDQAAQYVDVVCVNRYYGWYSDIGHLEVISMQIKEELTEWFKSFNKPIIVTEYGADTVVGIHELPSVSFSEEYQTDFLSQYHVVFDELKKDFLVGEMVWNFADFMTVQGKTRVVGNRKGLFTRQRQPKAAAFLIKSRYESLLNATLCN